MALQAKGGDVIGEYEFLNGSGLALPCMDQPLNFERR